MPELARIETVVVLQSIDFFSACTAEEVLQIVSIARERSIAPGEELFRERDSADTLYCVIRGDVEVTARDGRREAVGPLQAIGLADVLSGRLYSGTAVATTPALVLAIQAEDFFDLLSNNIDVVKSLFRHLIQRMERNH
ncbi:MAG TPA: cyclic nucleotide-binding domain-containing protein [Thermoanaerobaculia bacterium]|nr:cyclic nucleotide-binding domain-containing protein [Thermoanaerobaculia bacterium]